MSEMQTGSLAPEHATPGQTLAAVRTERGMSVSEVAQRLKFSMRHIEALEGDHYDALPGGPYVRGMVRAYAKLLGIEAGPLLDALPRPAEGGEVEMQPRNMSVPFPADAQRGSRVYLLLSMFIIVAVVVVLAEWFIRSQREGRTPEPAAATKVETPSAAAEPPSEPAATLAPSAESEPALQAPAQAAVEPPATAASQPPNATTPPAAAAPPAAVSPPPTPAVAAGQEAPAPSGPPPPGKSRLTLSFDVESWVEVTDANGAVLLSAINPAGTRKVIDGTAPITLVIGNASGVHLTYKGEPVALKPHRVSDVARLTLE